MIASASSSGTFRYIVTLSGNQTQPSIDGQFVVYSGPAASPADGTDVFVYDLLTGSIGVVASGPGDQDFPDTCGTVVAYRTPSGIGIKNWFFGTDLRSPDPVLDARGTGHPSIGRAVAAWELGGTERDVVVKRLDDMQELGLAADGTIPVPGDQHSPAAHGTVVAYIDEADSGAARWFDSAAVGSATRVGAGLLYATGIDLGEYIGNLVVAVTHSDPGVHDDDVEVWGKRASGDPAAVELSALHVPGVQRNPHVSSDWVAFEDLSTGHSQVVLWHWVDGANGVVFVPHPSASDQILNDLYVAEGTDVRVVFADDAHGDFDIALYDLVVSTGSPTGGAATDWPPQPLPPPPPPPPGAASCDDLAGATILAKLELARQGQKPQASSGTFDVPGGAGATVPVLVCVVADDVSSAWVTVDDVAVARPSDFRPSLTRLAIPYDVRGSTVQVSGVIAGSPGATLTAYVLADPARAAVSAGSARAAGSGCGTGGGGWPGVIAALVLVARRRRV